MSTAHGNDIAGASLPTPSDGLSSADEILKIEQEIARHAQIIIELKARRNSHLPIFQLPVEILCRIFRFTRDVLLDSTHYSISFAGFRSKDLAWIAVTHVCQHWRNAALSDPSLWTRPSLQYSKWTAVMLERSRMAGLRIVFDSRAYMREEVLLAVIPHISHTAELTIQGIPKAMVEKLLTSFRAITSPMMQKLFIDGNPSRSYAQVMVDDNSHDRPRLHEHTFLGTMKLCHLSLMAIDIDWKSHLLSSLTSLSIERVSNSARPTPTEFIDMLGRMPGLTSLSLHHALPTRENMSNNANIKHKRVPLPAVENLSIKSEVTECEFFWNSISTSSLLNNIEGVATYHPGSSVSFPRYLAAINAADSSERLETSSRSVLISGVLTNKNASRLTMRTSEQLLRSLYNNNISTRPCKSASTTCRLNIEVQNTSASPIYQDQSGDVIFTDLFDGMHWGRLSELDLTSLLVYQDASGFAQVLSKTFGTLSGLQTVMVGPMCATPLVDALLMGGDKDPAMSPNSITFPGLRYIQFYDVGFDEHDDENAVEIDRLQDCLMSRYERGVDVYSVIVKSCRHFGEVDLGLLQEIVVDIDWDGEERGDTEYEEDEVDGEYYGVELDSDYYDEAFDGSEFYW